MTHCPPRRRLYLVKVVKYDDPGGMICTVRVYARDYLAAIIIGIHSAEREWGCDCAAIGASVGPEWRTRRVA